MKLYFMIHHSTTQNQVQQWIQARPTVLNTVKVKSLSRAQGYPQTHTASLHLWAKDHSLQPSSTQPSSTSSQKAPKVSQPRADSSTQHKCHPFSLKRCSSGISLNHEAGENRDHGPSLAWSWIRGRCWIRTTRQLTGHKAPRVQVLQQLRNNLEFRALKVSCLWLPSLFM